MNDSYSSAIALTFYVAMQRKKAVLDLLTYMQVSDHISPIILDLQNSIVLLWRITIDMHTPNYDAIK